MGLESSNEIVDSQTDPSFPKTIFDVVYPISSIPLLGNKVYTTWQNKILCTSIFLKHIIYVPKANMLAIMCLQKGKMEFIAQDFFSPNQ